MKTKRFILTLTLFLIFSSSVIRAAAVPTNIIYQGLLSKQGLPFSGTTNFTFELVNSNNTVIWSQSDLAVNVNEGVYRYFMHVPVEILQPTNTYRLRVYVNGLMVSPDTELASVPYAYYAGHVHWSNIQGMPAGFSDDIDNSSQVWANITSDIFFTNGKVGIGTSQPQSDLHVRGTVLIESNTVVSNDLTAARFDSGFGPLELQQSRDLTAGSPLSVSAGANVLWGSGSTAISLLPDSLDFSHFKDTLTLDTGTMINVGANYFDINLNSTGDLRIMDAGIAHHYFFDNGDVRLGNNNEIRIDTSSGYVGIGDSTPDYKLDVAGTVYAYNLNTGQGNQELYGMARDFLSGSTISITGGGNNVLYGPDSDITLNVAGNSLDYNYFQDSLNLDATTDLNLGSYNYYIDLTGVGDFYVRDGTTTALMVNSIGDVQLGNDAEVYVDRSANRVGIMDNSPTYTLDVNGTGRFTSSLYAGFIYDEDNTSYYLNPESWSRMNVIDVAWIRDFNDTSYYLDPSGNTYLNGLNVNGSWITSDKRLKKDIITISNVLPKIMKMRCVAYNWRLDLEKTKNFSHKQEIGMLSQEVEKFFPELVRPDQQGYKTLAYSKLAPILLQAIREQQQQIDKLRTLIQNQ